MGLTGSDKTFCTDILRIEISSPTQPHLTLVDLPGLFLAGNKDQSVEDSELVRSLVLSYMKQPRSIILAVVSAKSELTLQQVTQRAREIDPEGKRTLGLITKPDTLHDGSESERAFFELAQNKDIQFRLGWHVLRNRDYNTRKTSLVQRNASEKAFFSRGVWASLQPSQLGVDALRERLSKVLHDQIITHLPQVLHDIQSGILECKRTSVRLGSPRGTSGERRRYLLHVSHAFSALVKASVEGNSSDRSFFGDSATPTGYERRLRAKVQNTLIKFAESMRHRGHATTIVEAEKDAASDVIPKKVHRDAFLKDVNSIIQRNRGRELPGTFNPLIVGEMFTSQCQPWLSLSKSYNEQVIASTNTTILAAIKHVTDDETAARLVATLLNPRLQNLGELLENKLRELLRPHLEVHPITYNHYLTANVQKVQATRHERHIKTAMEKHCTSSSNSSTSVVPAQLLLAITKATEPNMERYASLTATDLMEAYYRVAMKTFIDDVSVLAVEECLLQKLPSIFSSDDICDLSDEDVQRLATESLDITKERSRVASKREILEEGQRQLARLNTGSLLVE